MDPHLILIDGYNVIRRTPSLSAAEQRSLLSGRQALIELVIARYRGTPHRVLVVFDGDQRTESVLPLRCGVGSQQIFSAAGTSADEVIRRLVEQESAVWSEHMLVFSDDWEIGRHAASQGASAGSTDDLARHLTEPARHLRHRAQHHAYLRQREHEDAQHEHHEQRRPRAGNAHRSPKQRRGR